MIVVCPACATRFRVAATALGGASGRRLRCANCGKLWRYQPAAEEPAPPVPGAEQTAHGTLRAAAPPAPIEAGRVPSANEAVAPAVLDRDTAADTPPILRADTPSVPRLDAPPARIAPRAPSRRPGVWRRSPATMSLGLTVLVAAILLAGFFARHRLAAVWPAPGHAPAVAAVEPPSNAGLKVTLSPKRANGSLVIEGDIVNQAAVARRVPRMRVTLRDRHEAALASQLIDPPVHHLAPGASAHFNAVFPHPSGAATGVAVTFATD